MIEINFNLERLIKNWQNVKLRKYTCPICGKEIKEGDSVIFIAKFTKLSCRLPIVWKIIHDECYLDFIKEELVRMVQSLKQILNEL